MLIVHNIQKTYGVNSPAILYPDIIGPTEGHPVRCNRAIVLHDSLIIFEILL